MSIDTRYPRLLVATLLVGVASRTISSAWADDFDGYKSCVCAIGDVNGDGVCDFMVASRDRLSPQVVWILSGRDRTVLYTLHGRQDRDGFGSALAVINDIDHDGVPDLLVAATGVDGPWDPRYGYPRVSPPYARAYSGKKGTLLFEVSDGCPGLDDRADKRSNAIKGTALIQVVDIGPIGDVNGDGVDDILFGASDCSPENSGSVRLFSGRDGTLIRRITGTRMWFGACVARVGDLDNDGVEDFAVGSPLANQQKGEVVFYSGKTAKVLRTLTNPEISRPEEFFGWSILRAADYDRDGVSDILVSAEHSSVHAFSGKDWHQLFVVRSLRQGQGSFGTSLADIGDCDGDGYPDFAVGDADSVNLDGGVVGTFSGKDGKLLRELRHASDGAADQCTIDDIDGDGVRDLVLVFMPPRKSPILQIVSGKSGHVIQEIDVAKVREEGNALIQRKTPQSPK